MAKVLVNGCFDCLHDGHRAFLKTAASFGELLIGLNTDESIRQLKGPERPHEPWWVRAGALIYEGYQVCEFDGNADALVDRVDPDIIVRGWDQTISDEDRKHIVVIVPKLTDDSTTKNLAI